MSAVIGEGHPLYGHTTYTKTLARAAGYSLGEVRPPLTKLLQDAEGAQRFEMLITKFGELEDLVTLLEGQGPAEVNG
jgi:4-hydroxy-tetrahydrodipicolinate synthase